MDALAAGDQGPTSLPPHGSEVFIGGLDKSCTEDQLREFATEAGEVSILLIKWPPL
jgi:heterogeneous nuclear ribonucleoprotein R